MKLELAAGAPDTTFLPGGVGFHNTTINVEIDFPSIFQNQGKRA